MARGRARRPDARHVTRPETGAGGPQRGQQNRAEGPSPPPPARASSWGRPRQAHPLPPLPPRTRELLQFKLKSRYRGGDGGCLDASKVLKLLAFDLSSLQALEY